MVFLMMDFGLFCDVFEDDLGHLVPDGVAGDGAHFDLFLFLLHVFF